MAREREETEEYIRELCEQLAAMATQAGLDRLANLLSQVVAAASSERGSHRTTHGEFSSDPRKKR